MIVAIGGSEGGDIDEVCPSSRMCNMMVERLRSTGFDYDFEHIAIKGPHAAAAPNSEYILDFLENTLAVQANRNESFQPD